MPRCCNVTMTETVMKVNKKILTWVGVIPMAFMSSLIMGQLLLYVTFFETVKSQIRKE